MPEDVVTTPVAGPENAPPVVDGAPQAAPPVAAAPPTPAGEPTPPAADPVALAELEANTAAAEALVMAGLQALDEQIKAGHPEIEDANTRRAKELADREQQLTAASQLADFRAKSAMIIEAFKASGLPVQTLITLAKVSPSKADFARQVKSLTPTKPAVVVVPVAPAPATPEPGAPVDSGFNGGSPPKAEAWRSLAPEDKILYALKH